MNEDKDGQSEMQITYGEEPFKQVQSVVHLGVERNKTGRPDVQRKIQLGRRTMYSLMGVDAYGGSGLNPTIPAHLWKIYALPRVLNGLEVLYCLQSDIQAMEQLQRSILRTTPLFQQYIAFWEYDLLNKSWIFVV